MTTTSSASGQKVELNDGRAATIRFVGTTSFQAGDWIGVELEEATGKNDGSVKGQRYFECEQGYGMFLRPAGVKQVLEDVKPKGRGLPSKGAVNGVKRLSMMPDRRGSSIASSPTPAARSGLRSPTKSPTKQIGSNGASSTSTSRTSTPPVGKLASTAANGKPRPSLQPPSTSVGRRTSAMPTPAATSTQRTSRPSLAPPTTSSRSPQRSGPSAGRSMGATMATAPSRDRLSSTTEETSESGSEQPGVLPSEEVDTNSQAGQGARDDEEEEDLDDTIIPSFAPPPIPAEPPQPSPTFSRARRPSSPAAASIHSQRTIRSTAASSKKIEELEVKVHILERKRLEDRDVKKKLDQAQQDRDQYKGIIEKLQTKYRPQQQEITDLKRALSESEKKYADIETLQAEHDSALEMATLDREMAEETAEGLKTELEALRAHNEEVQLELDILREENGELTKEMSPEERSSAGWVQLQHSNERLRNALLALRDKSLDEKQELKTQLQALEEQVKDFEILRAQHDETRESLLRSQADTNDLREQLEVALQAEEMIEELTSRNENLSATVSNLQAAVEDLENLRELNDELEINHVEAEKQMQEEIDFKDSLLLDREKLARLQQAALDDRDNTITHFRALVNALQADMADMRASKQLTETEVRDLEGKSRAMLDLNLKLQNSAVKTQVKTIDLELRKLEAQEASEHLAIVQMFLPDAFERAEGESVLALLRFKRISFKASLLHGFVKESVASFSTARQDEDVFTVLEVLDNLIWIADMADRFVNSIRSCSVDEFAEYRSALHQVDPVERVLDTYIDRVRSDELREGQMAQELQRSMAVLSHLAEVHIKRDIASHADDLVMRATFLQSQLESAATALQLTRAIVGAHLAQRDDDADEEDSASEVNMILKRADTLMNQARSSKVMVGKAYRELDLLKQRSLTLNASCTETFDSTQVIATDVATYTRQAGAALQIMFNEEGRSEPFVPSEVASALSRTATTVFSLQAPEPGPFSALANRLRDLTEVLSELATLPNDLDNTVEFERGPAPWVSRVNQLKQTKISSQDTEAELARTLEALRSKDAAIRDKDAELDVQSVRIETLEARMKDASKRSAKIAELERDLHEAKSAEKKAKRDLERAREEQHKEVERAREEIGSLGDTKMKRRSMHAGLDDDAMGAGAQMMMKRQQHKITSLEGAVRYLKEENHRLRLPAPDSPFASQSTLHWLHEPVTKSRRTTKQASILQEGVDILSQLLSAASLPQTVDLTKMPENKLAWRPAKDSSRWKVERRKEEWEGWKDWRREVVKSSMPKVSRTVSRDEAHVVV